MKIFKRYKNRKLYDTEKSEYVTVQDILFTSLEQEVQIISAVDGSDITDEILLPGLLVVLDSEGKKKVLALAKKLFYSKSEAQNLNLIVQEESNVESGNAP